MGRVSCQSLAWAIDGPISAFQVVCASGAQCSWLQFSLRRPRSTLPMSAASAESATSDWTETATTDRRGEFALISVPIGDYVLTVSQPGFEMKSQIVTVTSGFSPVAHVQLAKGSTLETITVTAALDTALPVTSTPTTVVSRQDIERTP